MQLLFYSRRDDQNGKRIETAVQKVSPESQIELFKKMADFAEWLRMAVEPESLAVLFGLSK